jgi:hypothetical protein
MRFRSGLLAVVLPCLVLALVPSSASARTYELFCGLHPVDMTATIKVEGRRK